MSDIEPYEMEAIRFAGTMAGEYLDSISKTDLATLTVDEWKTFTEVMCINFLQKRAELQPCPF